MKVRGLCFHCDDKDVPGHKCKELPDKILIHEESDDPEKPKERTGTCRQRTSNRRGSGWILP